MGDGVITFSLSVSSRMLSAHGLVIAYASYNLLFVKPYLSAYIVRVLKKRNCTPDEYYGRGIQGQKRRLPHLSAYLDMIELNNDTMSSTSFKQEQPRSHPEGATSFCGRHTLRAISSSNRTTSVNRQHFWTSCIWISCQSMFSTTAIF